MKTEAKWQGKGSSFVLTYAGITVGEVEDRSRMVGGGFGVRYRGLAGTAHTGTMPFETAKQAKAWVVGHLKRELRSKEARS